MLKKDQVKKGIKKKLYDHLIDVQNNNDENHTHELYKGLWGDKLPAANSTIGTSGEQTILHEKIAAEEEFRMSTSVFNTKKIDKFIESVL